MTPALWLPAPVVLLRREGFVLNHKRKHMWRAKIILATADG